MKYDKIYNHLNAKEYLIVNHPELWDEILQAIASIDAGKFLKYSKDRTKKGEVLYSQKDINDEFKRLLYPKGWRSVETPYYVTDDPDVVKELVKINDKDKQKQFLDDNKNVALSTKNQVDFVKDKIAIEVQFGKYFSVAYDLHVKHTFFYSLGTINVGIEIIPTHEFMLRMDGGVSWWENEITNVMREGRSNPSVPIVVIGIEPEAPLIPLPDMKSAERVIKAQEKKDKAIEIQNAEQDNVTSLETALASEVDEKIKRKLSSQLEKAKGRLIKAQDNVIKADSALTDATEVHQKLEEFKATAKPIIEDLDNERPKRREELKAMEDEMKNEAQEEARLERIDEEDVEE